MHRRHDAGRVPQVHREGQRPGSPLPIGHGRTVDQVGNGRNPQGSARSLRIAPPRADHRRRAGGGRRTVEPLHHGPLLAGQGHRRDRRGRSPRAAEGHDPSARSEGNRRRSRAPEQGEGRGRRQPGFRKGGQPARSGRQAEEEEADDHPRVAREEPRSRWHRRRGSDCRSGLQDDRHSAHADDHGRLAAPDADGKGLARPRHQPGRGRSRAFPRPCAAAAAG